MGRLTLSPCRCGSRDITVYANDGWIGVECNDCDNATPRCDRTEQEAISTWNKHHAGRLALAESQQCD